jgi:predicted metal-binding protein
MEHDLQKLIVSSGFEAVARFDATGLESRDEVRAMCAADVCRQYDNSWSCPPACGSIAEFRELLGRYNAGYVFQTVANMEDEFDFEAIEAAGKLHKQRFHDLVDKLDTGSKSNPSATLLLSAGSCQLCPQCSYPDAPCRFPDKVYPSMEAAGLLVSDVCQLAGIPYYHGKNTIAFVSCALANPTKTKGTDG